MSAPPIWVPISVAIGALIWAQFVVLHSLRKQRDRLKSVTNYEKVLDALGEHFDEGTNKILNGPVASATQYGAWQLQWSQWQTRVENNLEASFGKREQLMFRNSVTFAKLPLGGWDQQHESDRSQVVRKLEMLRDIMTRHCDSIAQWRHQAEK